MVTPGTPDAPEKLTFSRLKLTFSRLKLTFSELKVTFRNLKLTFSPPQSPLPLGRGWGGEVCRVCRVGLLLWQWFLLQVCYDLRFPVFSRNRGDYDAIIYVANWPSRRRE